VPDSQLTKSALSAAMKELMAKYPMEKIKINDIVERCNMNRQSFYYHFKDKYDLVNWIFYTEFFAKIRNSLTLGWDLIEKICEFFYENRTFYSNALSVKGQNSFSEYFIEVMQPLIHSQFKDIFKDDQNHDFYETFFADSIRVSITRWLLEGAKKTPGEYVALLKTAATGLACKMIEETEEKKRDDKHS
jgi:probable dihydroxyacetone kinase regulator